jgi:hypothetical protein
MSITFKRFHASARLSQETTAYDTDVLFLGKPIGTCRNDGHGGQGFFQASPGVDPNLLMAATQWARQQPYLERDGSPVIFQGGVLMVQGIDEYCDLLASETLNDKLEAAYVKRQLKANVLYTDPAKNNDLFQMRGKFDGATTVAQIQKRHPGAVVLNDLPFEEALKEYRDFGKRQAAAAKGIPASVTRKKTP